VKPVPVFGGSSKHNSHIKKQHTSYFQDEYRTEESTTSLQSETLITVCSQCQCFLSLN